MSNIKQEKQKLSLEIEGQGQLFQEPGQDHIREMISLIGHL